MRQDLANIYAFCRYSDDLGDEGEVASPEGRRNAWKRLDEWEKDLDRCATGTPEHLILLALQDTIRKNQLPLEPFRDLISAFKQDQVKFRYETFDELLDYCRLSANPVGRIYLMMFGLTDERFFAPADKICTALQLTNFLQDVKRDLDKGRVYLPQEDMRSFDYSEEELFNREFNINMESLMMFEIERTRKLFKEGAELEKMLNKKLAFEIALFRKGGETILNKIERIGYDVFKTRPVLTKWDKVKIFLSEIKDSGASWSQVDRNYEL
jgi:squalene synthase HpnC